MLKKSTCLLIACVVAVAVVFTVVDITSIGCGENGSGSAFIVPWRLAMVPTMSWDSSKAVPVSRWLLEVWLSSAGFYSCGPK